MDTTSAPQMIEHLYKSLNFTPFDVKLGLIFFLMKILIHFFLLIKRWIPGTAKFCLMGQTPKAEGILQIFQLNKKELETSDQVFFLKTCIFK